MRTWVYNSTDNVQVMCYYPNSGQPSSYGNKRDCTDPKPWICNKIGKVNGNRFYGNYKGLI